MSRQWPTVPLAEILTKADEWIDIKPAEQYREVTVRLWGKGVVQRREVMGAEISATRRQIVRPQQFILSRIDARNGAFGLVPDFLDGAIVSNDFPVFNLNRSRIVPEFLNWMSKTEQFINLCKKASEGTTNRVRLKEERFLSTEIPLPPVSEQWQIVARIKELAAKIEEAQILRRQTLDKRRALWIASLRVSIEEANAEEIELEHVCEEIIDNLHSNPVYADIGFPCVRSSDVGWGTLNLSGALRTDEEEFCRRTVRGEPQPDDIVFVREGGGTGKAAIVPPGQRFSLGQRVMILRPNKWKVLPRFFLYQLLSPLIQENQILPLCKGSASPHLNIGSLRRFKFRLPLLSEQHRIVERLNALQAEIENLTLLQIRAERELNALLPAILDKAFKADFDYS